MNGQATSLLAFQLKRLLTQADDGIDISETVKELLARQRRLAASNSQLITADAPQVTSVYSRLHAI